MDSITWLDNQKNWSKTFFLVFVFSVSVVGLIEVLTYEYAPPRADFADEIGTLVFSGEDIAEGQQPDFTAEALNLTARSMTEYTEPPIVRGSRK